MCKNLVLANRVAPREHQQDTCTLTQTTCSPEIGSPPAANGSHLPVGWSAAMIQAAMPRCPNDVPICCVV